MLDKTLLANIPVEVTGHHIILNFSFVVIFIFLLGFDWFVANLCEKSERILSLDLGVGFGLMLNYLLFLTLLACGVLSPFACIFLDL